MYNLEKKVSSGAWRQEPKPVFFWYQMAAEEENVIGKQLRTNGIKSAIEVGCGSGRVVSAVLRAAPMMERMVGVERDPLMADFARTLFVGDERVEILAAVPEGWKIDLSLSMLNTAGNQAAPWDFVGNLFSLSTKLTIFSVYKKNVEAERRAIYAHFGHTGIREQNGCFMLNDGIVQNFHSASFSLEEVRAAVEQLTKKYEIIDASHLNYVIVLRH
jgi:SAM-dependent methyltransferase